MDDDSSSSCLLCDTLFTFTNRRHHCRQCLKLVCSACSSNIWKLDSGRSRGAAGRRTGAKRVCDQCYGTLVATREVLAGGDAATLDSGEHMHFKVVVHETLGRGQTLKGNMPPPVPVGPASPRPGLAMGFGGIKAFAEVGSATSPATTTSGYAPAEAPPRLPGSEVLDRARAPYCRLSVANKQVGKTRSVTHPLATPTAAAATASSSSSSSTAVAARDAGQGRQRFEQSFFFRVSCASR
ncbi:unnamed protein product, partial [Laminaria digitata]